MIGAAILFFIISVAVIGVTVWLVIREFQRVHTHIDVTDESYAHLQSDLKGLSKNVQSNYLLRGDFATASNALLNRYSDLDTRLGNVSASNSMLTKDWNSRFTTYDNKPAFQVDNVVASSNVRAKGDIHATAMHIGNNSLILEENGMMTAMSSATSKFDLNVPRMLVGKSLNVAGKLNFATTNSSYMLGVDGTSMYLKMADEQAASLQVRDPANTSILSIDRTAGNVSMTGCIKSADPNTTSSVCLNKDNTIALTASKVQIPQTSALSIGSFTFKEDANGQLVVKKGDTDVMVLSPDQASNKAVLRNLSGGSHTTLTAGSSNLTLVA